MGGWQGLNFEIVDWVGQGNLTFVKERSGDLKKPKFVATVKVKTCAEGARVCNDQPSING